MKHLFKVSTFGLFSILISFNVMAKDHLTKQQAFDFCELRARAAEQLLVDQACLADRLHCADDDDFYEIKNQFRGLFLEKFGECLIELENNNGKQ